MALSSDSAYVQVNVKYKVEGLEQARKSAKRAAGAFFDFGKILRQVGSSLIAFKAVDLVRQTLKRVSVELIRSNAQFEKFEIQLKVFTGSAKEAASLIDYLAFQSTKLAGGLEELLRGATALATFGLDVRENLTLIADIATATGRAVDDVAISFGRVVSGDPRTKQFLVTRRASLATFSKVLDETGDRLLAARAAWGRFQGVSEELEGSFFRLTENIGDLLFMVAKFVGEPAFERIKTWMVDITKMLREEIFAGEAIREDNMFAVLRTSVDALTWSLEIYLKAVQKVHRFQEAIGWYFVPGLGMVPAPWGAEEVKKVSFPKEREKPGVPTPYLELEFDEMFRKLKLEREVLQEWKRRTPYRATGERLGGRGLFELERPEFRGFPRAYADLQQMMGFDPQKAVEQAQEVWDTIAEGRISGSMLALKAVEEAEDRWNRSWKESAEEIIKGLKEKRLQSEREVFHARYRMARTLTERAVNDLGFIFFGGRGANRVVDERIARIREEIDVLDGITTPLTRQEQLLNRIVELEGQRVTINQRLGRIVGDLLSDITKAAAKAAVLSAVGFGGPRTGGGGFMNLFKGFLGLGAQALQFVPGLGIPARIGLTAAGAMVPNLFPGGGGGGTAGVGGAFGGGGVAGSLQKPVVINQPIFLSDDVRGVAERFADEASRRMR